MVFFCSTGENLINWSLCCPALPEHLSSVFPFCSPCSLSKVCQILPVGLLLISSLTTSVTSWLLISFTADFYHNFLKRFRCSSTSCLSCLQFINSLFEEKNIKHAAWPVGSRVPSASLLVAPSWVVQLVQQKKGMPSLSPGISLNLIKHRSSIRASESSLAIDIVSHHWKISVFPASMPDFNSDIHNLSPWFVVCVIALKCAFPIQTLKILCRFHHLAPQDKIKCSFPCPFAHLTHSSCFSYYYGDGLPSSLSMHVNRMEGS